MIVKRSTVLLCALVFFTLLVTFTMYTTFTATTTTGRQHQVDPSNRQTEPNDEQIQIEWAHAAQVNDMLNFLGSKLPLILEHKSDTMEMEEQVGQIENTLNAMLYELNGQQQQQQQQQQEPLTNQQEQPVPAVDCPTCPPEKVCPPPANTFTVPPVPPPPTVSGGEEMTLEQRFARYVQLHKDIMSGKPGVKQQYIIVAHNAQMNNRVRLLVTGILIGLLTDRAVLSDFSYHAELSDLFATPMDMEHAHFRDVASRGKALSISKVDGLLCTDLKALTDKVLTINQGPSLTSLVALNPFHRQELLDWFGTDDSIYRKLTQYFLVPSPPVQKLVDQFTSEHFAGADYVLGVHIRWGPDHRPQPVYDYEYTELRECCLAITPPPKQRKNVVIFIAADTMEERELAVAEFRHDDVRTVTLGDSVLRSNTVAGVQAALADLLILSKCDNLMLTPASSYGEQAMVLNGKPGYYTRSLQYPGNKLPAITFTHLMDLPGIPGCYRTLTSLPSIKGLPDIIQSASCYHPDMYPTWQ